MFLRKREREKSATRDRGDEGFVKCPVIFCYFVSSRPGRPPKRSPLMGITSPQHDVLMKMKKPRMDNGDYMPYENGHNTGRYCSNNNLKRSHHLLSVFLLLLSKAHNTLVVYLPPRLLPTFSFLSCSCYLISFFTCYQYSRDIFYLVIVALFFSSFGSAFLIPSVCCLLLFWLTPRRRWCRFVTFFFCFSSDLFLLLTWRDDDLNSNRKKSIFFPCRFFCLGRLGPATNWWPIILDANTGGGDTGAATISNSVETLRKAQPSTKLLLHPSSLPPPENRY